MPESEIQLQARCFQWSWSNYPETRRLLFAVPNGGKRSIMEAMQLKASGVVAGEPDLIFAWNGRVYGIEMKIPGGRASKDQESVHSAWMENGNPIFTCWSFEEFQKVFESIYYGNQ